MDVDTAASVLAGSILTGMALIVAIITVVIINNIVSKYWKPVTFIKFDDRPARFMTEEELKMALDEINANVTVGNTTVTTSSVTTKDLQ